MASLPYRQSTNSFLSKYLDWLDCYTGILSNKSGDFQENNSNFVLFLMKKPKNVQHKRLNIFRCKLFNVRVQYLICIGNHEYETQGYCFSWT